MATNYPTSLDTLTNPVSNDSLNSPSHSAQHANANDAIEAIEAKLGVGNANQVGMYHVNTTTFSGTTVTIDNVFTSSYERYKVYLQFTSSVGTDSAMQWRLRTGGVTNTTSNYRQQRIVAFSTTVVASENVTGTDNWTASILTANASTSYHGELTLYGPALTRVTTGTNTIATKANIGTPYIENHTLIFDSTTVFDGIQLATAGTSFNGTIRIYGLRDSTA